MGTRLPTGLDNSAHVLEKGGKVFSATLGLVDIVKGTNSYYKLQLLEGDKEGRCVLGTGEHMPACEGCTVSLVKPVSRRLGSSSSSQSTDVPSACDKRADRQPHSPACTQPCHPHGMQASQHPSPVAS